MAICSSAWFSPSWALVAGSRWAGPGPRPPSRSHAPARSPGEIAGVFDPWAATLAQGAAAASTPRAPVCGAARGLLSWAGSELTRAGLAWPGGGADSEWSRAGLRCSDSRSPSRTAIATRTCGLRDHCGSYSGTSIAVGRAVIPGADSSVRPTAPGQCRPTLAGRRRVGVVWTSRRDSVCDSVSLPPMSRDSSDGRISCSRGP